MLKDILTTFLFFLSGPIFSQGEKVDKLSKIDGKYGVAINAGSCYLFQFEEIRKLPFFLGLPKNPMIGFPSISLFIGNEKKFYGSFGFVFGVGQINRGSYLNHEYIKVFSSTSLYEVKLSKTILHRPKYRQAVSIGTDFARTQISSTDVFYYTAPNDTVQFFFNGKMKQNWILNLSTSFYFNIQKKSVNSVNVAFGLTAGYNLGILKGSISQSEGVQLNQQPAFNYSGPYVTLVMLQVWSKKKEDL